MSKVHFTCRMNQSEKEIVVRSPPARALPTTASGLKLRVQNIAKSLQVVVDSNMNCLDEMLTRPSLGKVE